jgi:hypothetical protein
VECASKTSAMLTARQPSSDGSFFEFFSFVMRPHWFLKHRKYAGL